MALSTGGTRIAQKATYKIFLKITVNPSIFCTTEGLD